MGQSPRERKTNNSYSRKSRTQWTLCSINKHKLFRAQSFWFVYTIDGLTISSSKHTVCVPTSCTHMWLEKKFFFHVRNCCCSDCSLSVSIFIHIWVDKCTRLNEVKRWETWAHKHTETATYGIACAACCLRTYICLKSNRININSLLSQQTNLRVRNTRCASVWSPFEIIK